MSSSAKAEHGGKKEQGTIPQHPRAGKTGTFYFRCGDATNDSTHGEPMA
jgi:hypothetical protein